MSRSKFVPLLLSSLTLSSCSDVVIYERPSYEREDFATPDPPEVFESIAEAPWQAWRADDLGDDQLRSADEFARRGEFEKAIREYDVALTGSGKAAVKEEALTRKLGTMLKLGRSKEVLTELSRLAQISGQSLEKLGAENSLIAAFAYQHQRDLDQTLAWLGVAYRGSGGGGEVGRRAREQARGLMRRLRPESFESYARKWSGDTFISGLLSEERGRRAAGGKVDDRPEREWFRAAAYQRGGERLTLDGVKPLDEGVAGGSDLPPATAVVSLGVLLPLSGQYSEHAERVKRGVELAIALMAPDGSVRAVYADSKGEELTAASEYERLVRTEHVAAVLGPLLVKETEAVAKSSRGLRTPFLTFTKKARVTELSNYSLRLGATAEDQVNELVNFLGEAQQIKSLAIVTTDVKEEMIATFKRVAAEKGIRVVATEIISPLQEETLREALKQLGVSRPEGIFFPDSIEKIAEFLKLLQVSDLRGVKLCGVASWNDPIMIRGYGPLLENAFFVTPFFAGSSRPEVMQFVEQYSSRFGDRAELLSAQAFDAARLVLSRLLADPSQGALRLREPAMAEGVTGRLEITSSGEIHRSMSIVEIKGGQGIELAVGGVPTGALEGEIEHGRE